MKRLWWGVVAGLYVILLPLHLSALSTTPSDPNATKMASPILITGYSFAGHSVRYVQLYNASNDVVSLSGWKVTFDYAGSSQTLMMLEGKIAPAKYVTVANTAILPTATFGYVDVQPAADPILTAMSVVPPQLTNYNSEVASVSTSSSTPKIAGTPATYYFARNLSSTTGNYVSGYTAFVPASTFSVVSDGLYEAPKHASLDIVEIYPDATPCSPLVPSPLCSDYVKVHNNSSQQIDVSKFRLRTGSSAQSATSSTTVRLSGILEPGAYGSFALSLNASGSWVWLEDAYGILRYDDSVVSYPSSSGHDAQAYSFNPSTSTWEWTAFPSPDNVPNSFATPIPINLCAGLRVSEIAANVELEEQYVELMNDSDSELDVTGCILETNRSTTKQYVLTRSVLAAHSFLNIYIKDTDLTLTKTTNGTVYLLSSDQQTELDAVTYNGLKEDTSWSLIDGQWVESYVLTPGAPNTYQQYLPCAALTVRNPETGLCVKPASTVSSLEDCGVGKYRSPDTNRCRSIETATSPSACGVDQYRSPDTNRCRSILTTTSSMTLCAANQIRNPETNRCRLATASETTTKPCAANQERNPDTNRCRNKGSSVTADFPVEAVAQSSQATMGWWAFGGVGLLAAGYAGWEWRREVSGAIVRFGRFIITRS